MDDHGKDQPELIDELPLLTMQLKGLLTVAGTHLTLLAQARSNEYRLSDTDLEAIVDMWTETRSDLAALVAQRQGWQPFDLAEDQRSDVESFDAIVSQAQPLVDQILGLTTQLRDCTVEALLGRGDHELFDMNALLGNQS